MAEAAAARPTVVGGTLNEIAGRDPEILDAVLDVMEAQELLESGAEIDVLPMGASFIVQLDGRSGGERSPHPVRDRMLPD
jgi:hypothetical protein